MLKQLICCFRGFGSLSRFLALVTFLASIAAGYRAESQESARTEINETFSGGNFDRMKWTLGNIGVQIAKVDFSKGTMRVVIPPSTIKQPLMGLESRFGLEGDFDISVDYSIRSLPRPANEWVNLSIFLQGAPGMAAMTRTNHSKSGTATASGFSHRRRARPREPRAACRRVIERGHCDWRESARNCISTHRLAADRLRRSARSTSVTNQSTSWDSTFLRRPSHRRSTSNTTMFRSRPTGSPSSSSFRRRAIRHGSGFFRGLPSFRLFSSGGGGKPGEPPKTRTEGRKIHHRANSRRPACSASANRSRPPVFFIPAFMVSSLSPMNWHLISQPASCSKSILLHACVHGFLIVPKELAFNSAISFVFQNHLSSFLPSWFPHRPS